MRPHRLVPRAVRWAGTVTAAALLGLAAPKQVAAQNDCGLDYADLWRAIAQDTPAETHFFTDVTFSCADGTIIYADSAIVSPPQSLSQWFGNVRFTEEGRELTADRATYRSDIDRLDAFGNVTLADSTGSTLDGDNLVYLRGGDDESATELTMVGLGGNQPHATIIPASADSAGGEPPEPYDVVADRIVIEGTETFRGEGRVHITRETLDATGRSMLYDAAAGELLMAGDAASKGDGYELVGEAITVVLPNDAVEGVIARGDAVLTTDDMDLTAPKIHIFVQEEALQRLVAAQLSPEDATVGNSLGVAPAGAVDGEGDTRATALTQDFLLLGDSLDVQTPGEVLERVVAVGRARGESFSPGDIPDVETPELARNDWLEGDTIIATFIPRDSNAEVMADSTVTADSIGTGADSTGVTSTAADSTEATPDPPTVDPVAGSDSSSTTDGAPARERYALDQLVARGAAKSLYRMDPSDTTGTVAAGRRALHYVVGDGITITMVDGEVDRMEVTGKTQGFHLEPLAVGQAPDSIGADSTAVADTLAADTIPADTLSTEPLPADTLPVNPLPPDTLPVDTLSLGPLVGGQSPTSAAAIETAEYAAAAAANTGRSYDFGVAPPTTTLPPTFNAPQPPNDSESPRRTPWQKR